jgi:hypothetical protein
MGHAANAMPSDGQIFNANSRPPIIHKGKIFNIFNRLRLFSTKLTSVPIEADIDFSKLLPFRRSGRNVTGRRHHFLTAIMGGVFDSAFRNFAAAFEDRANLIYGKTR